LIYLIFLIFDPAADSSTATLLQLIQD